MGAQAPTQFFKHSLLSLAVVGGTAWVQKEAQTEVELDTYATGKEVQGDLGLLPTEPVGFIVLNGENHHLLDGETRLQVVEAMVVFLDKRLKPRGHCL